jgi:hypothetical protein
MEDLKPPQSSQQPAQAPDVELVKLRHPYTKDTVEVDNTAEALTPYMARGYEQYHEPAKETS